jgi:hypothetical protein
MPAHLDGSIRPPATENFSGPERNSGIVSTHIVGSAIALISAPRADLLLAEAINA